MAGQDSFKVPSFAIHFGLEVKMSVDRFYRMMNSTKQSEFEKGYPRNAKKRGEKVQDSLPNHTQRFGICSVYGRSHCANSLKQPRSTA